MNITLLPVNIKAMHILNARQDIFYSVIEGMQNTAVQHKMNYQILALLHRMNTKQGFYENAQTEITGSFEIKTNERGILSLSLINYAFSGGAHGLTIIQSLTMNVHTGQNYALHELFKEGSNYVEILSAIIKKQIKERNIILLNDFKAIKPNQDFYIADKALIIYFQLYDITPYVFGFPSFPISVYDIQSIVNEQGPLEPMLTNM